MHPFPSLRIVNFCEESYHVGMEMVDLAIRMPRSWELRLRQLAEAGEYETLNDMLLELLEREFPMPETSHTL